MEIDFTEILHGLDGSKLTFGACPTCGHKSGDDLTLRRVCVDALLGTYRDEIDLSGTDRLKRFILARKLTDNDVVALTSEEITHILNLIPKRWSTLVYGNVVMTIDPARLQE